jgi:dTDP-4-dehydrorhamnose 3,5-epimerase-like enzyme
MSSPVLESTRPVLIQGGLAADNRGELGFVNDFRFEGVQRFYTVSNYRQGFVRAWHAHRREGKYVSAIRGAAVVGAVRIDDWEHPSPDAAVEQFVLTEKKPAVLYIPPGYANGFMSLTPHTKLIFFSTATLEESGGDDFRYDSRYWDVWHIVER